MDKFQNPFYDAELSSSCNLFVPDINPSQTYNCKTKIFPDGSSNSCVHRSDIFGRDDYFRMRSVKSIDVLRRDFLFEQFRQEYKRDNIFLSSGGVTLSIQNQINNNIGLMELGFITPAECVRRNQSLYKTAKLLECFGPFKSSVPRPSGTPRHDSFKRAKDKIYDYILCNEWTYFFTGTINPKKMDSSKPKECLKPLKKWLENMVARYGIAYICIFEYHKKGNIHMHGLILENPDKPLKVVDSGTKLYFGFKKPMKNKTARRYGLNPDNAQIVYNLSTWRFGWSTAIKVYGEPQQLAHYVTKYITKDNKKIFGKYYWHSRNLDKPKIVYCNVDFDSVNSAEFHGFKYTDDISLISQEREKER